jgi:hypothetical protein
LPASWSRDCNSAASRRRAVAYSFGTALACSSQSLSGTMRYVILLAAAGAALAPSHKSRSRGVALRALNADALETKRLQCFSAFDESETRLAMRLIAAAESEEASLADSASEAFASSLARLRRYAFPDAVDAAWRDEELAAWNWTAPLVSACDDIARELQTVLAGDADGWDGAEYQAIAADWSFLSLWQGGGFTDAADAMPKTKRALEAAMALGLRIHPLQAFAAGIAKMPAGSRISPHCDGGLLSFTAHLGLVVPDKCALTVGGETRRWAQGEFFAFDPSWVHAAVNDGDTDRYVLLLQPLRDDVRDEDVAAVAHYLHPNVHPPGGREYPFWLTRGGRAHATWLGFDESQVELATGRFVSRRDATLVYPAPAELGSFAPREPCEWLAAPFADAPTTGVVAAEPVLRPRYVGVDDAGGVDWIGVADGDVSADAVLRDPGLLRWVPQAAVDQVAPPKPAPRRKRSEKRRKKRAFSRSEAVVET